MVQISVDVSQDTYERLEELSIIYRKNVDEIIAEITDFISSQSSWIENKRKEYNVPRRLTTVLAHIFHAGIQSSNSLFTDLLEQLEAKGRFIPNDMEFDLDEMSIWINYAGLTESDLYVDDIDVNLSGLKRLSASYSLNYDRVDSSALEKIKDIIKNIHKTPGLSIPDVFNDVMEHHVDFVEDEDFLKLTIDIVEESMGYLPSIPAISVLFRQILNSAGIDHSRTRT